MFSIDGAATARVSQEALSSRVVSAILPIAADAGGEGQSWNHHPQLRSPRAERGALRVKEVSQWSRGPGAGILRGEAEARRRSYNLIGGSKIRWGLLPLRAISSKGDDASPHCGEQGRCASGCRIPLRCWTGLAARRRNTRPPRIGSRGRLRVRETKSRSSPHRRECPRRSARSLAVRPSESAGWR
jgi:hypothetical protein